MQYIQVRIMRIIENNGIYLQLCSCKLMPIAYPCDIFIKPEYHKAPGYMCFSQRLMNPSHHQDKNVKILIDNYPLRRRFDCFIGSNSKFMHFTPDFLKTNN